MFARYASAVSTGTVMTFALLYCMQLLISLQPGAEGAVRERLTLGRVNRVEATPVRPEPEPVDRKTLTDVDTAPRPTFGYGDGIGVGVSHLPPGPGTEQFTITPNKSLDGPLVTMLRVAPIYPASLRARGTEGTVLVRFDVTADGLVTNIEVLESSHKGFNKAAIRAAERFKFKPRVVDGIALASSGIQNLFRFQMDDRSAQ